MINDFDSYFSQLPPFDREKDFESFWDRSIRELRDIPMEASVEPNKRKIRPGFNHFDVGFKGLNKSRTRGKLLVPEKADKPRVVLVFHDYFRENHYLKYELDNSVAYFFLELKGHDMLKYDETAEERKTPGYMVDNILDIENYYVRQVYLDAYRSIDMLRLRNFLDCSSVGIIGKGFGAAMALFAAYHSGRVKALFLDTPSFAYLPVSQNISKSDATAEINGFIEHHRTKNRQVKKNLSYFDALNFSDKVSVPCMVSVGFKDPFAPPQCVFALFNHLLCDKTMEVYPDQGSEAGGEKQFQKSLKWMIDIVAER